VFTNKDDESAIVELI